MAAEETPPAPADPFGEVTTIAEDAAWTHEVYQSYLAVGFTEAQAFRLTRDRVRWAWSGGGWDAEDEPDD